MTSPPPPIKVDLDSLGPLKGKTIIVTGASSGIGLETAELFYELGCNVVFVGGRKYPPANVPKDSPRVLLLQCNVASWDSQVDVFTATIAKFGQIDIVCPNAGVAEPIGQYFDLGVDEKGRPKPLNMIAFEVDMKGTAATVALSLHYMREKGGSVVIMSSKGGYVGVPVIPSYSASKHGVLGLLRSLSGGAAQRKIPISLVSPGITFTPGAFAQEYKRGEKEFLDMRNKMSTMGIRLSSSRTCGLAVAYLAVKGLDAAGTGLMVDDDEIYDVEQTIQDAMPAWLVKKLDDGSGDEYANMVDGKKT